MIRRLVGDLLKLFPFRMDLSYDTDEDSQLSRSGSYFHKQDEVEELKHLLDEKSRELELAASLGQHLLGENKVS